VYTCVENRNFLAFNPLKTKCRMLYLKTQSVPRSKHFSSRLQNTDQFMLYGAEIAVYSEINTKHIHCGYSVQFLNVKLVGASSNK